ncbi:MAG: hypothetical protein MHM6MM_002510 [Cercozoa sp. M6MM]
MRTALVSSFHEQASLCRSLGAPLLSDTLSYAAHAMQVGCVEGDFLWRLLGPYLPTQERLRASRPALRWSAAWHYGALAQHEGAHELRALLPTCGHFESVEGRQVVLAAHSYLRTDQGRRVLERFMQRSVPQTNEVGRSVGFVLGMQRIQRYLREVEGYTGPIRVREIGSSAGLCMLLPHIQYRLHNEHSSVTLGDPDSELVLESHVTGDTAKVTDFLQSCEWFECESVQGCDLQPVVLDEKGKRTLRAFVWPDEYERMQRLEKAMDLMTALHPIQDSEIVQTCDAADFTRAQVTLHQQQQRQDRVPLVFCHSVVAEYFDDETEAQVAACVSNSTQVFRIAVERSSRDQVPLDITVTGHKNFLRWSDSANCSRLQMNTRGTACAVL